MVVAVDGLAPANGFDGLGSLFPGSGWGRPEGGGGPDDWGSMAWVVGREAVVHAILPSGPPVDFFARCLPYPWDAHAPLQTLELLAGDRVLGRVDLVREWQDVRLPLPEDLPRGQLVDLRLRFAHALRPGNDSRSLAAAFTELAVIPRAVPDPKRFLEDQTFDPETGRVTLPPSGGLRLPLPRASHVRFQLTDLRSECQGCALSFELSGPRGIPGPLASDVRGDARTAEVSFDTGPRGIYSLWIRSTASRPGASGRTEFVLGPAQVWPSREPRNASPPSVFVYLIDTLRADALAPYGGRPEIAPRMNAFAKDAVVYSRSRAASSWTLPSVVSLLTGVYPDRHGVMNGSLQYDPQRQPSLQRLLGERGYRTVGISHSFIASAAYGVDRGFTNFYLTNHLNGLELRSQEAHGFLATWLSQYAEGRPVFAYLHTVDPHLPYTPPPGFRAADPPPAGYPSLASGLPASGMAGDPKAVAYLRALYEGEVHYADREFGRFVDLLKWLGLYDQSLVILVGDHGEEFVEHGGFEHGRTVFEEVLRVPLVVKYPGGRWAGRRVDAEVSLVDVAPTVLAALPDGGGAAAFDGRVLPVPDTPRHRDQPVYFEVAPAAGSEAPVDLRGLVVGNLKCIENRTGVDRTGRPVPRLQAFDLAADPGERRPYPQDAGETARCGGLLEGWSAARARQVREQRSRRIASPEAQNELRALGYIR